MMVASLQNGCAIPIQLMTKYHQRATGLINDSPRSLVSSPKTWMRFAEKLFEDDRSVSFYVFLMHPLGMDFPMKAGVGSLITCLFT